MASFAMVGAAGLCVSSQASATPGECGTPGTARVSVGDGAAVEGAASGPRTKVKLPITLSQPSSVEVDVTYTIHAGTAGPDVYSKTETPKVLKFVPNVKTGLTPSTKFVTVQVLPGLATGNESFTVELSSPTGSYAIGRGTGTGTVLDDTSGPGQHVSIAPGRLCEGDSGTFKHSLVVSLATPDGIDQSATVTVTDGTATGGTDYKAVPKPKMIKFKAGVTTQFVTLSEYGDTAAESDETVNATITGASVAIDPARTAATLTIVDDEAPITPGNLAPSGTASQSSNFDGCLTANKGNDGFTNGFWTGCTADSIFATSSETNAWWQVDLGTVHPLTSVKVFNRTDCCANRARDLEVVVDGVSKGTIPGTGAADAAWTALAPNPQGIAELTLPAGTTGQVVRIVNHYPGPQILNMGEVQVFGL